MKRIISMLLAIALMATMLPCTVFAAGNDDKGRAKNPEYISSIEKAGDILRDGMVDREKEITIYYEVSKKETFDQKLVNNLTEKIYKNAVKHTGDPREGDFVEFCTGGYKVSAAAMVAGDVYKITLVYYVNYYTDAKQEKKLDQEIEKLKKKLDIDKASDLEKVKAIHDYIKDNVSYDYEGREDTKNKLCHTAYAALINGKAVCQGYATLFYRLALEYGIDTRIISGKSLGDNHGWNIVKIDGEYYNIDTTWDSTTKSNKYYLKNEKDFVDHARDAEYKTSAFHKAYPMAKESYEIACSKHEGIETTTAATTSKDGKIVKTCKNCGTLISTTTISKIGTVKLSYTTKTYSGSTMNPKITVKDAHGKTISASNYKITKPSGRKNVGVYKYQVKFNGKKYSGSKTLTLTINPKAPTISSASAAKKAFTAKWKKVSAQADGYQVEYATNKNFTSGKKTVKVKGIKSTSKKITGLNGKKTYYVRVRSYKVVSGKTYYSDWSKTKSVKTKS